MGKNPLYNATVIATGDKVRVYASSTKENTYYKYDYTEAKDCLTYKKSELKLGSVVK